METPRPYTAAGKARLIMAVLALALIILVPAIVAPTLLGRIPTISGASLTGQSARAAGATTTQLSFDIMPVKPGGPAENWPAYMASTPVNVPANTIVTVTIRNFDLGDAALSASSPFAAVKGTIGGVATFNGQPYKSLDPAKVAHTFTIPRLGVNVPIPGDAPNNDSYLTVVFSFRTGHAGDYTFECLAPCGTDTGFGGPMATAAYMKGTLTVE